MKIYSTLSLGLVISIFLSIQMSDSLLTAKTASTVLKIISGANVFDENFWNILDTDEMLKSLKSYEIGVKILSIHNDLKMILMDVYNNDQLESNFTYFENETFEIDEFYSEMVSFYLQDNEIAPSSREEMIDKCQNILGIATLRRQLESVHKMLLLFFSDQLHIYETLNGDALAFSKTCSKEGSQQSIQSMLYNFFTLVVAAEVKIFSMLNIARDYSNYFNRLEMDSTLTKYDRRLRYLTNEHKKVMELFKAIIPVVSTNVWRCDPDTYKEDSTHVKFKNLFQANLRAKLDITMYSTGRHLDDCGLEILSVNKTIREPKLCPRNCAGTLYQCEYFFEINSENSAEVCLSENGTHRMYDFVITDHDPDSLFEGKTVARYGSARDCKTPLVKIESSDDAHELLYCVCDNDVGFESSSVLSERKFYTGTVLADVDDNFVVTGARLRKHKEIGIVYIQIQQGKLLPGGNIDNSTLEWKEIPEEDLKDYNKRHTLSWRNRNVELHDIDLPQGHALVGIKFNSPTIDDLDRLRLKAFSQPINIISGKVFPTDREPVSHDRGFSSDHLEPNGFYPFDYNLNYSLPSDVVVSDKYMSFEVSGKETDFGQNTIPYIDIQDLTTKVPYPMSGVGLYYRESQSNMYAGFLGLKLKTYNFSRILTKRS